MLDDLALACKHAIAQDEQLQAADALAKAAQGLTLLVGQYCVYKRKPNDPPGIFDFTDLDNALTAYEKVRGRE